VSATIVKSRLESLDWLRGLMACSVMFYHLTSWNISKLDSSNTLARLGIYAVSIFFVLSGLSMAIAYNKYFSSIKHVAVFFLRRIFRIWPLLWLATICSIVIAMVLKTGVDPRTIFLNLTTLFGFVDHTAYIATGAWSIGNEVVYYAFTPLIIIIYNFKKWMGDLILVGSILVGCYFAFNLVDSSGSIGDSWHLYIHPLNNLFFYIAGISLFYHFKDLKVSQLYCLTLLGVAIIIFCFYPTSSSDAIGLIAGIPGVILSTIVISITLLFYKIEAKGDNLIGNTLTQIGIVSYGIYLIHPLVNVPVKYLTKLTPIHPYLHIGIVAFASIIVASILFYQFELKFTKIGKKLSEQVLRS
jgi:exopolysaccharide production protein ExoZ